MSDWFNDSWFKNSIDEFDEGLQNELDMYGEPQLFQTQKSPLQNYPSEYEGDEKDIIVYRGMVVKTHGPPDSLQQLPISWDNMGSSWTTDRTVALKAARGGMDSYKGVSDYSGNDSYGVVLTAYINESDIERDWTGGWSANIHDEDESELVLKRYSDIQLTHLQVLEDTGGPLGKEVWSTDLNKTVTASGDWFSSSWFKSSVDATEFDEMMGDTYQEPQSGDNVRLLFTPEGLEENEEGIIVGSFRSNGETYYSIDLDSQQGEGTVDIFLPREDFEITSERSEDELEMLWRSSSKKAQDWFNPEFNDNPDDFFNFKIGDPVYVITEEEAGEITDIGQYYTVTFEDGTSGEYGKDEVQYVEPDFLKDSWFKGSDTRDINLDANEYNFDYAPLADEPYQFEEYDFSPKEPAVPVQVDDVMIYSPAVARYMGGKWTVLQINDPNWLGDFDLLDTFTEREEAEQFARDKAFESNSAVVYTDPRNGNPKSRSVIASKNGNWFKESDWWQQGQTIGEEEAYDLSWELYGDRPPQQIVDKLLAQFRNVKVRQVEALVQWANKHETDPNKKLKMLFAWARKYPERVRRDDTPTEAPEEPQMETQAPESEPVEEQSDSEWMSEMGQRNVGNPRLREWAVSSLHPWFSSANG